MAARVDPGSVAAQEVARRAAEEAAKKAAEEAAKRASEEAAKRMAELARFVSQAPPRRPQDSFSPSGKKRGPDLQGGSPPSPPLTLSPKGAAPSAGASASSGTGSTLRTENTRDRQVNCLDQAGDYLASASPETRRDSEVLFLRDTRPGAEGQTGHVIIRQGDQIFDPSTKQWSSQEDFFRAHPEYQVAGTASGESVHQVLQASPGSARDAALAASGIDPALFDMVVADLDPNNPGVRQADADYQQLLTVFAPPALVADFLQQHSSNSEDDKQYRARLMGRLMQGGQMDNVVGGPTGAFSPGVRPPAEQATITEAFRQAFAYGTVSQDAVLARANQNSMGPWGRLAESLGLVPGANVASEGLRVAQARFDTARGAANALDARLNAQLAKVGSAMDEGQRNEYIRQFRARPEYAAVYSELTAATDQLLRSLASDPTAVARAVEGSPEMAARVVNAMAALADSDQAKALLEQVLPSFPQGSAAMSALRSVRPDFDTKVMQPALANAATELYVEAGSMPGALERLFGLVGRIFPDLQRTQILIQSGQNLQQRISQAVQTGRLDQLVEWMTGPESVGPITGPLVNLLGRGTLQGILTASAVIGGLGGAFTALNNPRGPDYARIVASLAGAGRGGLEALAGLSAASRRGLETLQARGLDSIPSGLFARAAPFFGFLANGFMMAAHLQDFDRDNGDWGLLVSAAGDAIAAGGAFLELFPGAQGAGLIVGGVGAAVSVLGQVISWVIQQRREDTRFKEEERTLLMAAGLSEGVARLLVDADPQRLDVLYNSLDIQGRDFQHLAATYPLLITVTDGSGLNLAAMDKLADIAGLSGGQVVALLDQVTAGSDDPDSDAAGFAYMLMRAQLDAPLLLAATSRQELISRLRDYKASLSSEEQRASIQATIDYLRGLG